MQFWGMTLSIILILFYALILRSLFPIVTHNLHPHLLKWQNAQILREKLPVWFSHIRKKGDSDSQVNIFICSV